MSQGITAIERFDVAISNPPYQLDTQSETASRRTTVDVFPDFHMSAASIANTVTMIYPATWQKSLTKGLGKFLIDHGLQQADNYNGTYLFPQIRKNFNISVVISTRDYNDAYTVNGTVRERELPVFIDDERKKILYDKTFYFPKLYGATFPNKIPNVEKSGLPFQTTPEHLHEPVSVYIKKRPGLQADGAIHWIEREALEPAMILPETLDRYDVCIQSSFVGRMHVMNEHMLLNGNLGAKVYGKNATHSNTWIILDSFYTEEEAENYTRYVNSRPYSLLIMLDHVRLSFASYIPDLENYTNENPVFTPDADLPEDHVYKGLSLDQRLYHLFGLTDEEIAIVEERKNGKL